MQQFTKLDQETKVVGVTDVDPYSQGEDMNRYPLRISEDLYIDDEGHLQLVMDNM
jgi:hypothetical protein